jgi:hypothetical protein
MAISAYSHAVAAALAASVTAYEFALAAMVLINRCVIRGG